MILIRWFLTTSGISKNMPECARADPITPKEASPVFLLPQTIQDISVGHPLLYIRDALRPLAQIPRQDIEAQNAVGVISG
jgi:hypothetical protein